MKNEEKIPYLKDVKQMKSLIRNTDRTCDFCVQFNSGASVPRLASDMVVAAVHSNTAAVK